MAGVIGPGETRYFTNGVDTETGSAAQGMRPMNKRYRAVPVPVSTVGHSGPSQHSARSQRGTGTELKPVTRFTELT